MSLLPAHRRRRAGLRAALCLSAVLGARVVQAQDTLWTPDDARALSGAQAALEAGGAREALSTLDDLLAKYPGSLAVQRLRGHALAALDRAPEARAAFADALARGGLSADVLTGLLRLDYAAERVPAVLAESQLLLLIDPDEPEWQRLQADLLLQFGNPAAAELVYRTLLERAPTPELCERIARAAYDGGRREEAASYFETAYYLGSSTAELPGLLVTLWLELGDTARSETWRERAPESRAAGEPPLRAAQRLYAMGDLPRARAAAEALFADASGPDRAQAAALVGRVLRADGQPDAAAEWFQRALDAGSEDPELFAVLGSRAFNARDMTRAADLLARAWDAGRRDAAVLPYLVQSALDAGRTADADRFLVEYLERHGLDATARRLIELRAARAD